jgi:ABC-type Mn2+/Zn2+ transport system ATPase subunit
VDGQSTPLFRFEHVSCSYGGAPVLQDVTFMVDAGEFVGIVGPSGGGKTTVLRTLLGTVEPAFGSVRVRDGVRLGYVPQVELVDWSFPVTAHDVVAMTIEQPRWRLGRTGRVARAQRVAGVLDRLGIGELQRRPIGALSGGQQQRVFLARALVHEPDVLVLDEPAGGVDVATRHEMLHLLADLHHDGTTVVLSTHDINGLAAHLPRIICMNRTVVADGPPEEVLHPYVLERTYGAPMQVLQHGGMPVVVEHPSSRGGHGLHDRLRGKSA